MTVLRIFVSYEATDAAFATQLMTDLREAGAEVITDNVGLEDTTFEQFLSEQLPLCQYLIMVQTPAALQSSHVRAMVDSALKLVQEGQMTAVLRVIAPSLNGAKAQALPLRWANTPEFDASQDYARASFRLRLQLELSYTKASPKAPPPVSAMPVLGSSDPQGIGDMIPMLGLVHAQKPTEKDRPHRPPRSSHTLLSWRFILPSLAIALVLVATSVIVFIHQNPASVAKGSNTPVVTPTSTALTNLDDDPNRWKILSDQPGVTLTTVSAPTDVTTPSADGNALQASFTDQGILVYRELPPANNATNFELSLSFYLPAVTPITGLAFTAGKLVNGQWWEWALQWSNSPNGASWNIWNGNNWQNTHVTQSLSANTWHNLQLKGDIINGQVHYISFSCDKVLQNLNQTFAPGSRAPGDHLAIFIELDGVQGNPYQVYTDKTTLQWS